MLRAIAARISRWFNNIEKDRLRKEQEYEDTPKRLRLENAEARERSPTLHEASESASEDRPAGRRQRLSSKYAQYPTYRVCRLPLAEIRWEKGVHFGRNALGSTEPSEVDIVLGAGGSVLKQQGEPFRRALRLPAS